MEENAGHQGVGIIFMKDLPTRYQALGTEGTRASKTDVAPAFLAKQADMRPVNMETHA